MVMSRYIKGSVAEAWVEVRRGSSACIATFTVLGVAHGLSLSNTRGMAHTML